MNRKIRIRRNERPKSHGTNTIIVIRSEITGKNVEKINSQQPKPKKVANREKCHRHGFAYLDIVFGVPLDHDAPHGGDGDDADDVDQVEGGEDGEDDVPEPEADVDLLVDDVQGEHAHRVVHLDRAGGTVLVEVALGDPGRMEQV